MPFTCTQGFLPLALRLGFVHIVAPNINAMPPDKHSIRIRILLHGLLEKLGEVLLMGGILNDRDPQGVMIPQVARLAETAAKALDLLDVVDFKYLAVALGLEQEGDKHGPLGVCVDAARGAAAGEGGEEERRALGGLVRGRGA